LLKCLGASPHPSHSMAKRPPLSRPSTNVESVCMTMWASRQASRHNTTAATSATLLAASFHFFFFFFFFCGSGRRLCRQNHEKSEEGCGLPALGQLTILWSGAPSSGTACSLELSLPSPTGIWFKTPLPVGGANTATLIPMGEMVSRHPRGLAEFHHRLQRPGVWGSPATGVAVEYPLNLWGASCLTLAMVTLPATDRACCTGPPRRCLTSLPGPLSYARKQAHTYLYHTAGVGPTSRGQ